MLNQRALLDVFVGSDRSALKGGRNRWKNTVTYPPPATKTTTTGGLCSHSRKCSEPSLGPTCASCGTRVFLRSPLVILYCGRTIMLYSMIQKYSSLDPWTMEEFRTGQNETEKNRTRSWKKGVKILLVPERYNLSATHRL